MKPIKALSLLKKHRVVALVGNPNTGKSTIFHAITGVRQHVANYPGVTVEKRSGWLQVKENAPRIELIDLPGMYSLAVTSADEAVVLDLLAGHLADAPEPDVIVIVLDAANLSRSLFLASQILELGKPAVMALNMVDLASDAGLCINTEILARNLGCAVVPVVATQRKGIAELQEAIQVAVDAPAAHHCPAFPQCVCAELDGLTNSVREVQGIGPVGCAARTAGSPPMTGGRMHLMQTLLDPGGFHEQRLIRHCGRRLAEELHERRERIRAGGESVVEVEARIRYAWIDRVLAEAVTQAAAPRRRRSEWADRALTHPVVGMILFLLLMGFCFQAIYAWAAPLMDTIEVVVGSLGEVVAAVVPSGALQSLFVDGAIAGVGAVLVFLPQILILFLFIAILEDCGYMARAAVLMDRWMALVGLNGKSFIPLLSSFACAVPGIMATRTIEGRRDRLVTILIAPLMSCSARLPVYVLLIGAFIPATPLLGGLLNLQAATLLAMYLVGAVVAVAIAWLLKHTVFRGAGQPFLIELPTYKWPSPSVVLFRMYQQGKEFCVSAGTIIFAVALVVWVLGYYPRPASIAAEFDALRAQTLSSPDVMTLPTDGDFALADRLAEIDREESGAFLRQSFLGRMGQLIEPAVRPLGWDWRIATAAIASFPAREVFIATMGTIYNLGAGENEESAGLREQLHTATWPDGRPVFNIAVALSIMVFFALCCQCGATLAVIKRETNSWRWPLFTFVYMTVLAYLGAWGTYRIGTLMFSYTFPII